MLCIESHRAPLIRIIKIARIRPSCYEKCWLSAKFAMWLVASYMRMQTDMQPVNTPNASSSCPRYLIKETGDMLQPIQPSHLYVKPLLSILKYNLILNCVGNLVNAVWISISLIGEPPESDDVKLCTIILLWLLLCSYE